MWVAVENHSYEFVFYREVERFLAKNFDDCIS